LAGSLPIQATSPATLVAAAGAASEMAGVSHHY